jgi:hypothetical protein
VLSEAELVAFRIRHHDVIVILFLIAGQPSRAEPDESLDFGFDLFFTPI